MAWPDTVRKSDLRIDYYRGSGAGGQHRNKRDTACRITHKPTGLVSSAEDSRSQADNRTSAFRKLAAKLKPMMLGARESVARQRATERVRTYHAVRGTVKDDRLPGEIFRYPDILNGKLDGLIAILRRKGTGKS